ncbi:MAG: recombinase family protein [Bacilli bacterium]|nr:recombinase family protein [Bacilli bacterium]
MSIRAGIYVRVSTDEQRDNGYSIDNQIRNLEEYCHKNNYEIIGLYNDAGHSGKNLFRPAMQKMLEDIKNGKIDKLVAIKVDRLTRNGYDGYWLLNYCEQYNVKIELSLEPYDVSTANGEMIFGMNLIFGQRERKEIGARTKRGLEEMALQKRHPGEAPYGYVRSENGYLEINTVEVEVVREIYELCSKGTSSREIARIMRKENRYLNHGKWSDDRVYNILSNPIYNGTFHFGKRTRKKEDILVVKDYCSKIIDDKLYKMAMRGLEKNKHSNYGSHIHLFSSLVKCPECGKIMSSTISYKKQKDGTNREYYFVECRNIGCRLKGKNYNADKIEEKLIKMLNELMVYSIMNDKIITIPTQNNKEELLRVEKAIDNLSKQEKKLIELYISSDFNVEVINEKNKMIKVELEKLRHKAKELSKGQVLKFDTNLLELFNKKEIKVNIPIPNIWNTLKKDVKKDIISKYIMNIDIKRDSNNNIEITSINFNNDFLQNSLFNFTTHLVNSMSNSFSGIKMGTILTSDNIIEEIRDSKVISFYDLSPSEIARLEEIGKYYNSSNITISPYMINNKVVDYKIIILDNTYN